MTTTNEKTIIVKTATESEYRINITPETSLETFKDHFHLKIFLYTLFDINGHTSFPHSRHFNTSLR